MWFEQGGAGGDPFAQQQQQSAFAGGGGGGNSMIPSHPQHYHQQAHHHQPQPQHSQAYSGFSHNLQAPMHQMMQPPHQPHQPHQQQLPIGFRPHPLHQQAQAGMAHHHLPQQQQQQQQQSPQLTAHNPLFAVSAPGAPGGAAVSSFGTPGRPAAADRRPACRFFGRGKGCQRGEQCPYRHEAPPANSHASSSGTPGRAPGASSAASAVSGGGSGAGGGQQRSAPPACRWFLQGNCNKGKGCKFAHTAPAKASDSSSFANQDEAGYDVGDGDSGFGGYPDDNQGEDAGFGGFGGDGDYNQGMGGHDDDYYGGSGGGAGDQGAGASGFGYGHDEEGGDAYGGQDGYDQDGYDQGGYDQVGYDHQSGYDQDEGGMEWSDGGSMGNMGSSSGSSSSVNLPKVTRTTKKGGSASGGKQQDVCRKWLAGRCQREHCRFLHAEASSASSTSSSVPSESAPAAANPVSKSKVKVVVAKPAPGKHTDGGAEGSDSREIKISGLLALCKAMITGGDKGPAAASTADNQSWQRRLNDKVLKAVKQAVELQMRAFDPAVSVTVRRQRPSGKGPQPKRGSAKAPQDVVAYCTFSSPQQALQALQQTHSVLDVPVQVRLQRKAGATGAGTTGIEARQSAAASQPQSKAQASSASAQLLRQLQQQSQQQLKRSQELTTQSQSQQQPQKQSQQHQPSFSSSHAASAFDSNPLEASPAAQPTKSKIRVSLRSPSTKTAAAVLPAGRTPGSGSRQPSGFGGLSSIPDAGEPERDGDARSLRQTGSVEDEDDEDAALVAGYGTTVSSEQYGVELLAMLMPQEVPSSTIVGSCVAMCPAEEIQTRQDRNKFSLMETFDHDSSRIDPAKAVKMFRRSSAGEVIDPQTVRPAPTLLRTMQYLVRVIDQTKFSPTVMYDFISDRFRSIRKDFACQGLRGASSMDAHEQMVRFHALCVYRMLPFAEDGTQRLFGPGCRLVRGGHIPGVPEGASGIWGNNGGAAALQDLQPTADSAAAIPFTKGASMGSNLVVEPYDRIQNIEKLTQSLTTLLQMYEVFHDSRNLLLQQQLQGAGVDLARLLASPHEPEMHSYRILVSLADPSSTPMLVAKLSPQVSEHPMVRTAVQAFLCLTRADWVGWFRLVRRRATFLQACLMHPFFERVRNTALVRLAGAFHQYPLHTLQRVLGFDDRKQLLHWLSRWEVPCAPHQVNLRGKRFPSDPRASPDDRLNWLRDLREQCLAASAQPDGLSDSGRLTLQAADALLETPGTVFYEAARAADDAMTDLEVGEAEAGIDNCAEVLLSRLVEAKATPMLMQAVCEPPVAPPPLLRQGSSAGASVTGSSVSSGATGSQAPLLLRRRSSLGPGSQTAAVGQSASSTSSSSALPLSSSSSLSSAPAAPATSMSASTPSKPRESWISSALLQPSGLVAESTGRDPSFSSTTNAADADAWASSLSPPSPAKLLPSPARQASSGGRSGSTQSASAFPSSSSSSSSPSSSSSSSSSFAAASGFAGFESDADYGRDDESDQHQGDFGDAFGSDTGTGGFWGSEEPSSASSSSSSSSAFFGDKHDGASGSSAFDTASSGFGTQFSDSVSGGDDLGSGFGGVGAAGDTSFAFGDTSLSQVAAGGDASFSFVQDISRIEAPAGQESTKTKQTASSSSSSSSASSLSASSAAGGSHDDFFGADSGGSGDDSGDFWGSVASGSSAVGSGGSKQNLSAQPSEASGDHRGRPSPLRSSSAMDKTSDDGNDDGDAEDGVDSRSSASSQVSTGSSNIDSRAADRVSPKSRQQRITSDTAQEAEADSETEASPWDEADRVSPSQRGGPHGSGMTPHRRRGMGATGQQQDPMVLRQLALQQRLRTLFQRRAQQGSQALVARGSLRGSVNRSINGESEDEGEENEFLQHSFGDHYGEDEEDDAARLESLFGPRPMGSSVGLTGGWLSGLDDASDDEEAYLDGGGYYEDQQEELPDYEDLFAEDQSQPGLGSASEMSDDDEDDDQDGYYGAGNAGGAAAALDFSFAGPGAAGVSTASPSGRPWGSPSTHKRKRTPSMPGCGAPDTLGPLLRPLDLEETLGDDIRARHASSASRGTPASLTAFSMLVSVPGGATGVKSEAKAEQRQPHSAARWLTTMLSDPRCSARDPQQGLSWLQLRCPPGLAELQRGSQQPLRGTNQFRMDVDGASATLRDSGSPLLLQAVALDPSVPGSAVAEDSLQGFQSLVFLSSPSQASTAQASSSGSQDKTTDHQPAAKRLRRAAGVDPFASEDSPNSLDSKEDSLPACCALAAGFRGSAAFPGWLARDRERLATVVRRVFPHARLPLLLLYPAAPADCEHVASCPLRGLSVEGGDGDSGVASADSRLARAYLQLAAWLLCGLGLRPLARGIGGISGTPGSAPIEVPAAAGIPQLSPSQLRGRVSLVRVCPTIPEGPGAQAHLASGLDRWRHQLLRGLQWTVRQAPRLPPLVHGIPPQPDQLQRWFRIRPALRFAQLWQSEADTSATGTGALAQAAAELLTALRPGVRLLQLRTESPEAIRLMEAAADSVLRAFNGLCAHTARQWLREATATDGLGRTLLRSTTAGGGSAVSRAALSAAGPSIWATMVRTPALVSGPHGMDWRPHPAQDNNQGDQDHQDYQDDEHHDEADTPVSGISWPPPLPPKLAQRLQSAAANSSQAGLLFPPVEWNRVSECAAISAALLAVRLPRSMGWARDGRMQRLATRHAETVRAARQRTLAELGALEPAAAVYQALRRDLVAFADRIADAQGLEALARRLLRLGRKDEGSSDADSAADANGRSEQSSAETSGSPGDANKTSTLASAVDALLEASEDAFVPRLDPESAIRVLQQAVTTACELRVQQLHSLLRALVPTGGADCDHEFWSLLRPEDFSAPEPLPLSLGVLEAIAGAESATPSQDASFSGGFEHAATRDSFGSPGVSSSSPWPRRRAMETGGAEEQHFDERPEESDAEDQDAFDEEHGDNDEDADEDEHESEEEESAASALLSSLRRERRRMQRLQREVAELLGEPVPVPPGGAPMDDDEWDALSGDERGGGGEDGDHGDDDNLSSYDDKEDADLHQDLLSGIDEFDSESASDDLDDIDQLLFPFGQP